MCNGTTLQEWQARCLENLLSLDSVQVALLIIDDNANSQTIFDTIKEIRFNRICFHLYWRFLVRPRASRQVDMTNSLSKVPSIRCKVIKKEKFSQYFDEADIRTIRGYDLDFILKFGFGSIGGEILNVARYGIWSFHHDDEEKYRGGPSCFWEIYNGDNVNGAILQRLTDRLDAIVVLKKGFLKTINYSYAKNINAVYFESARWPAQICIDIRNGNADYLNASPSQTKAPVFYAPNNLQVLLFVIKTLRNFLSKRYNALFRHDQWNIGIIYEPIHVFLQPGAKPKIHYLRDPKKGKSLADPFGILINNKLTILCEEFDYSSFKGTISSIELIDGTYLPQPTVAIDLPVHMSYPYLFEYQGEIYCIPETSQAREISLYKAQKFPYRWIKVATLIKNIAYVDATVFQYEGLWWLTCTDKGSYFNLYVWYASELLGPWKPHAANPVKTDISSVRPAGTPFIYNSYLYRPAQDCSRTYGERIVLNRVTRLTPTEFKEEQAAVIEPYTNSPFPDGVHTVSSVGDITLIDGKRFIFIGSAFKRVLIRWLTKIFRVSLTYTFMLYKKTN